MPDIAPIPNALSVKARAVRKSLQVSTSGDLRFANPRGPWKIDGTGSIEIEGQVSKAVSISLGENKASDDTIFGNFQPPHRSGPAYLSLLLSPCQWEMLVGAMHGACDFELLIEAVVSLDVALVEYSESFGGEVIKFTMVLSAALGRDQ